MLGLSMWRRDWWARCILAREKSGVCEASWPIGLREAAHGPQPFKSLKCKTWSCASPPLAHAAACGEREANDERGVWVWGKMRHGVK